MSAHFYLETIMISNEHKTLFVHIPKAAGQSIELAFLNDLGLSWQQRDALLLKHNTQPQLGPPRLAHLSAQEYLQLGYLCTQRFSAFFKFAFVRNPWARLVSEYEYRRYPYSFNDFLFKHFPTPSDDNYRSGDDLYRHVLPQADLICDQRGKIMVDFIGRFERLHEDFSLVAEQVFAKPVPLPYKNKTQTAWSRMWRKKRHHYSAYYCDAGRKYVATLYERDIDLFKYSFKKK